MSPLANKSAIFCLAAALALPASTSVLAQPQDQYDGEAGTTVTGNVPADLTGLEDGPEIEGLISARSGDRIQIVSEDGSVNVVSISEASEIRAAKGPFNLARGKSSKEDLLNGLPVTVKTVQWGNGLIGRRIIFDDGDFRTASMIRNGTAQGFAEQTAATAALRGRVANIDQYNVKRTTDVNFDTGKAALSAQAKAELCATAAEAEQTDNALMLVVGYTDSTGPQELNQRLSEKRASSVVNYLQQACGWQPYRMLTPAGLAESNPVDSNDTPEGKARNRRVAVNILVSKSVDGL